MHITPAPSLDFKPSKYKVQKILSMGLFTYESTIFTQWEVLVHEKSLIYEQIEEGSGDNWPIKLPK